MHYWTIMPAAGSSRRMGAGTVPKQYLELAGRSVIECSLAPFLEDETCRGVLVVLARGDERWARLPIARHPKIETVVGGAERADSVRAGLSALRAREDARGHDWVLVHDAARPCLTREDLRHLIRELQTDDVGGLLAAPLVDTLKRADASARALETVPRAGLWRALTPQMFRLDVLTRALALAHERGLAVTDEAQAVEVLGLRPRLVRAAGDNLKITVPEDLLRAERILGVPAKRSPRTTGPLT